MKNKGTDAVFTRAGCEQRVLSIKIPNNKQLTTASIHFVLRRLLFIYHIGKRLDCDIDVSTL